MSKKEAKRTYPSWINGEFSSEQKRFTEPVPLLDENGNLISAGWADRMLFKYDNSLCRSRLRSKEWDFYQISDGKYVVQLCFANISLGGYVSATLIDMNKGASDGNGKIASSMAAFIGGKNKYRLPPNGDVPNIISRTVNGIGSAQFCFETRKDKKLLKFMSDEVECEFIINMPDGLENLTTVLPFKNRPSKFFMTTKKNCMPCEGYFKSGDIDVTFSKPECFACLDWGRVNTPYRLVWYWGNGSSYIKDSNGEQKFFGFEITWGIGDESKATETAVFYDGKLHKFGAIDVERFPKPDRFMEPWHFISEDGRFDFVMKPIYDNHNDLNLLLLRMHTHQVHGLWTGRATLDDGTILKIEDMYAFCEYVENRW